VRASVAETQIIDNFDGSYNIIYYVTAAGTYQVLMTKHLYFVTLVQGNSLHIVIFE